MMARKAAQIEERFGPVVARISSVRSPGVWYEVRFGGVRERPDLTYTCNCPGWRFRLTCKHVEYCRREHLTVMAPITTTERPAVIIVRQLIDAGQPYLQQPKDVDLLHTAVERMATRLERLLAEHGALMGQAVDVTQPTDIGVRRIILED